MAEIERHEQETDEKTYRRKHYTMALVSYANREEIQPIFDIAKHYAYILHDRDKDRDPHYHILVTFDLPRSFRAVVKMIESKQNTFAQSVKSTIGSVLEYFTHATDTAIAKGKEPYDESEVEYDSEEYWKKRALQDGESWKDYKGARELNETFVEDLLSPRFSVEAMGRQYGRDFIKNVRQYKDFREMVLYERLCEFEKSLDGLPAEIDENGVVETFHATISRDEFEALQKWREENLFLNQRRNNYENQN